MVGSDIFGNEKKERKGLSGTPFKAVSVFVISFFILFFLIGNIVSFNDSLQTVTVSVSNPILNVFGVETTLEGLTICSNNLRANINLDCTCFIEVVLFFSILIAFPIRCRFKRTTIAVLSVAILFGMSIVRIVSILTINKFYGLYWFDIFHVYVWSITVILFPALLLFVFCRK